MTVTREEYRETCIEAIKKAIVTTRERAIIALDSLDRVASVRRRYGNERWPDELTNPPEHKP